MKKTYMLLTYLISWTAVEINEVVLLISLLIGCTQTWQLILEYWNLYIKLCHQRFWFDLNQCCQSGWTLFAALRRCCIYLTPQFSLSFFLSLNNFLFSFLHFFKKQICKNVAIIHRYKGESQNGCYKKRKHVKFSENRTFKSPRACTYRILLRYYIVKCQSLL